ncbi:MAG: hypothetical protein ABFD79_02545 [Phycisphaerales bacterium]
MEDRKVYQPKSENQNERKIILALNQPLTAKQIAAKTGIPKDTCSHQMAKFVRNHLAICLNPIAGNTRVYWLTENGQKFREELCMESNLRHTDFILPNLNWELYGWICFNQRSVVLRALTEPMQPSQIRRRIKNRFASTKITSNNIRDVIRLLEKQGVVQKVFVGKRIRPKYELTETGLQFQKLLNNVPN